MDIVFPENTGQLPQVAKRPLSFSHVLAVVYCFGGVAGVLTLLAKFVTTPLFEQLTYDRSVFANEARTRLMDLNALLAASVSRVPPVESARSGYVDAVVAAGDDDAPRAPAAAGVPASQMRDSLQTLRLLVKSSDPNDEALRQLGQLSSQTEEVTRYVRSLQYAPVPGTFMSQILDSSKETEEQALGRVIVQCKNDIRALKGSLLSS